MSTLLPCDAVDKTYPLPQHYGGFDMSNVMRNVELSVSFSNVLSRSIGFWMTALESGK
jgi:hypothetical protein